MLFFISSFSVLQLIASDRPQMIECVPAGWFCSALEPPRAACGTEASAYSSCPKHGHWLRPASFVLFTISNDLLTVSQSLDVRLNLLFDLFIFISYLFIFFLTLYSWDIWKCVLRVRPVLISYSVSREEMNKYLTKSQIVLQHMYSFCLLFNLPEW